MPDPRHVEEALRRVPLRVHMDIVVSPQMLVDPADTVILLPAQTRYEMEGGVTETSTERRIIFSPEIPGPRIGEARAEWEVFTEIARRAKPELADAVHFGGTSAIRADIARAIPSYEGIENLGKEGDQFQYGGRHLCWGWKFQTPDGKAHFSVVDLPQVDIPEDRFVVATRRGKQFNSMVYEHSDQMTGAVREAVLMNEQDALRLGLRDGDRVLLSNEFGSFAGQVRIAPLTPEHGDGGGLSTTANTPPVARDAVTSAIMTISLVLNNRT